MKNGIKILAILKSIEDTFIKPPIVNIINETNVPIPHITVITLDIFKILFLIFLTSSVFVLALALATNSLK